MKSDESYERIIKLNCSTTVIAIIGKYEVPKSSVKTSKQKGNLKMPQLANSMINLTNFVLYDEREKDKENSCLFDLNETEVREIAYFAQEIDEIGHELNDLSEKFSAYKHNYANYCRNFLELCDRKDVLFNQYVDYYKEYILNKDEQSVRKKLNEKLNSLSNSSKDRTESTSNRPDALSIKPQIYMYSVPTENRFSILSKLNKKSQN
jgi:hypothetical protein